MTVSSFLFLRIIFSSYHIQSKYAVDLLTVDANSPGWGHISCLNAPEWGRRKRANDPPPRIVGNVERFDDLDNILRDWAKDKVQKRLVIEQV